jgi:hypothetical protein
MAVLNGRTSPRYFEGLQPNSKLVVSEHHPVKARFPVIDVHIICEPDNPGGNGD